MSDLIKLLEGVKVEWKTLGEIAQIVRGVTYNKSLEVSDDGLKILRANNITVALSELNYNDVKQINKNAKVKKEQKLFKNDILISVASGSKEHVGKVAFVYNDIDYYFGGFMAVIRNSDVHPKFLFHILKSKYFKDFLATTFESATINNLSNSVLQKFKIPIPCPDNPEKSLKIQEEIVRILDSLSEETNQLTAALQKELDLHQKQYNFYREELFKFEGKEVEWKSLGEVYKFQYGKGNTIPTNGGEYPVYGSNGIVGTHTDYNSEDAPVIGHIGAYAGIVNWASGKHFVTYNGVICKLITGDVIPRYGYYQLLKQDFNSLSKNSSQPFVSYKELNSVIIPIPTVEIQQEIVRVLDSLTEEINQLTKALQKEISLRNKLYEFYRDRLLSFPK